jgi:hypothetical protein
MKITIYRYPHPTEQGKWIYTGQTNNLVRRDRRHRNAKVGFGRRFKKAFLDMELPHPEFQEMEVQNHIEANEEETIAIFRNRTWHGQGGMNLTLPGSDDYKNFGKIGGQIGGSTGGRATNKTTEGRKGNGGRKNLLDGTGIFGRSAGQHSEDSRRAGLTNVITGQIHRLGVAFGPISGRKAVESGQLSRIRSIENSVKGGRIGGRLGSREGKARQGRINGLKAAENGNLARARVGALHIRWHVRRNIINPNCSICQERKAA